MQEYRSYASFWTLVIFCRSLKALYNVPLSTIWMKNDRFDFYLPSFMSWTGCQRTFFLVVKLEFGTFLLWLVTAGAEITWPGKMICPKKFFKEEKKFRKTEFCPAEKNWPLDQSFLKRNTSVAFNYPEKFLSLWKMLWKCSGIVEIGLTLETPKKAQRTTNVA